MAISKTLELIDNFNESIFIQNAYVHITQVSSTKNTCMATCKIFRSKNKDELEQRFVEFDLDLEGPNPIKQAYLHLKSLPEFADAVDC